MQGNGLAGSSTRFSLAPPTAWCYEQTNDATDQPSGGNAPPDGVIQWAERLWLVPEQKKMNIAPGYRRLWGPTVDQIKQNGGPQFMSPARQTGRRGDRT